MEYGAFESIRFVGFSDANKYMNEKSNTLFLASRPNTDAKKVSKPLSSYTKEALCGKDINCRAKKMGCYNIDIEENLDEKSKISNCFFRF